MKKLVCVIIAVLLVVAAVAVLYSDTLLFKVYDKDKADELLKNVTRDEVNIWQELSFENFPLYGSDEKPGVTGVLKQLVPYVNGDTQTLPDINAALSAIYAGTGFWEAIYSFIILSLLTIPVYMLLRLVPFNTLFRASDEAFLLARPFLRGLTACACSVVSVTVTWFMYHTIIADKVIKAVSDWAANFTKPEIALTVTNIVIIVVAAVCVIYLLKTTLFRGSFLKSILLSIVRTALFVLIFGIVNTFMGCDTLRVCVFALAMILAIGIVDMIIDPPEKSRR